MMNYALEISVYLSIYATIYFIGVFISYSRIFHLYAGGQHYGGHLNPRPCAACCTTFTREVGELTSVSWT